MQLIPRDHRGLESRQPTWLQLFGLLDSLDEKEHNQSTL